MIVVSAVVVRNTDGALLTVRKRGTERFMLPGGKPEPGESAQQAAVRECAEEVGLHIDVARLELLGTFEAAAANEAEHLVRGTVFVWADRILADAQTTAAAEIGELRWIDPQSPPAGMPLAPLLVDHVLQRLR